MAFINYNRLYTAGMDPNNAQAQQLAGGQGAIGRILQPIVEPLQAQRSFDGAGGAQIPGFTGAAGNGAGIPGFQPQGMPPAMPAPMAPGMRPQQPMPQQPMGFMPPQFSPFTPRGGLSGIANRVYGQSGPKMGPTSAVPQGLLELLASNPNAARFLGRGK